MKILFICTHNRCRSILSEAITNHHSDGVLDARSAGSQPCGEVHPLSLRYLEEVGIETKGLISQSWDEFESFQPDVVITVCDHAANEVCPVWFDDRLRMHWGLTDPSKLDGTEEDKAEAFRQTIHTIIERTRQLMEIASQPRDVWPDSLFALTQRAG